MRGLLIKTFEVAGGDQVDEVAIAVLISQRSTRWLYAVGEWSGFVAILRDVDFCVLQASTGWTPLPWRVVNAPRRTGLPLSVMATAGIFCSNTKSISFEICRARRGE